MKHAAVIVGAALLGLALGAWLVPGPVPHEIEAVPEPPTPVGTYQYLHIEGPLLLVWDTRTGQSKVCAVRPGNQRLTVDCP